MHVLSSIMGFALPALIPRAYTHFASAVSVRTDFLCVTPRHNNIFIRHVQILFLYFGYKLLKDAYEMDDSGPSEELQEVEEELRKSKGERIVTLLIWIVVERLMSWVANRGRKGAGRIRGRRLGFGHHRRC